MFLLTFQQQQETKDVAQYSGETSTSLLLLDDFSEPKRKRYKKDTYFSDEEEIDNDEETWQRDGMI